MLFDDDPGPDGVADRLAVEAQVLDDESPDAVFRIESLHERRRFGSVTETLR